MNNAIKKLLLLTLLFCSTTFTFAQEAANSDLYLKVLEVMKTELDYVYDPNTSRREKPKADTAAVAGRKIIGKQSTPIDWPPLLILDGKPVNMNGLNKYTLEAIEIIDARKDKATTALYGTTSKNGVIFITTKEGSKK